MKIIVIAVACTLMAGLAGLAPEQVRAQAQEAQYLPYPPPSPPYDQERERQWRREERRRERARQEWYDEKWRRRMQRYFGGAIIQPYPGESYQSFTRRVRQQCNAQWNRCASFCNTIRDPYRRAACVGNCNNELYECNSGF